MSKDYAKRFKNRTALKAKQAKPEQAAGVCRGEGFGNCGFNSPPALNGLGSIEVLSAVTAFGVVMARRRRKQKELAEALQAAGMEAAEPSEIREGPAVR